MKIEVQVDGETFVWINHPDDFDSMKEALVSDGVTGVIEMKPESLKSWRSEADKIRVREAIQRDAGDTLSLLGTTSDAATIAVLVGACVMASLDEDTFAKFRAKASGYMNAISGDHNPTEIAQAFLASLAAGEVRLPALEKGIVPVLAEVTARGNAVAEAINPSAES